MMKLTILVFAVVIATAYACHSNGGCHGTTCPTDHVPYCNPAGHCECQHQAKKRFVDFCGGLNCPCLHASDCARITCPHNYPAYCDRICACLFD